VSPAENGPPSRVRNGRLQLSTGSSRPFLTNPTPVHSGTPGETAVPFTTFRTDSWEEPSGLPATEAPANVPSAHYSEANEPPRKGDSRTVFTGHRLP